MKLVDDEPTHEEIESDLRDMTRLMRALHAALGDADTGVADFSKLTNELVADEVAAAGLQLPPNIVATAVASLRAGKHLLLTGPPGTGKTSFAQAIGAAAQKAGVADGWMSTTATADWTSADTVGGLWLSADQQLRFRAGQVLQAIDANAWLLIDEFNRADVDKAIGQLFTVLSGHAVVLPFMEQRGDVELAPSIVPPGATAPEDSHPHMIDGGWRMIATLNTRDRDLLFSLSYALLRRFAIIDLPVPPPKESQAILESAGSTSSAEIDARIVALTTLPHRRIGPAILLDCASYARTRLEMDADAEPATVIAELLFAFVLPQLDDLTRPQQRDIVTFASQKMLQSWSDEQILDLFERAFQVSARELAPSRSMSDAERETSEDGPEAPLSI